MYTYVYVYTYIHIYMYVYVYIHIYIHTRLLETLVLTLLVAAIGDGEREKGEKGQEGMILENSRELVGDLGKIMQE